MCLCEVKEFKPCTTGYKVVCKPHKSYHSQFQGTKSLPKNRWLDEATYRESLAAGITPVSGVKYPFGFHIWHTKDSARKWVKRCDTSPNQVILKVKVKNPRCTGLQGTGVIKGEIRYARVTVSQHIKIIEEVNER